VKILPLQQLNALCQELPGLLMEYLNLSDIPLPEMNLSSVLFIQEVLKEHFDCLMNICGSDGKGNNGYLGDDGNWQSHYWLEGIDADGIRVVVDITTKPGFPVSIMALPLSDISFKYVCGDEKIILEYLIYFASKRNAKLVKKLSEESPVAFKKFSEIFDISDTYITLH
jgi:hypothetical protein